MEGKNKKNNNNKRKAKETKPLTGKKLSHALSWALRHQAITLGLTITPDGYVPVDEILTSTHPKLQGATLEEIQKVVETNDKQRFGLTQRPRSAYYGAEGSSSDPNTTTILCIRANQGHSLKIIDPNLLLKRLSPEELRTLPRIVHGTYLEPWKMIQTHGLNKMNRTHIHFASGLPEADGVISGMRKTCTVYVFVDPVKCANDGIAFYRSDNGVILTSGVNDDEGTLPSTYFSHVTGVDGTIFLDNRSS
jgi:2'-phosphotransferase